MALRFYDQKMDATLWALFVYSLGMVILYWVIRLAVGGGMRDAYRQRHNRRLKGQDW